MTDSVLLTLQIVNATAFLLVGGLALGDWGRGRERRRGYLAIALGSLGLVALGVELESVVGPDAGLSTALIVLLPASGAGLVLYRNSILPMPRWGRALTVGALAGGAVFGFATRLPGVSAAGGLSALQYVALNVLLASWCLTVSEAAYRLARLSAGLPPVQRARLVSLAAGYGGIIVVAALTIVAAALGGRGLSVALQAFALVCVPPLYLGLAPPHWLQRLWRLPEEVRLRRAIHDLLLSTPDRATLARRGVGWAVRLVGGEAGLIAEPSGELLAFEGFDEPEARELLAEVQLSSDATLTRVGPGARAAIVQHLPLHSGSGILAVVAGRLSPTFGADEVEWIASYAASMAIALDRARVAELAVQRESELERARYLAEKASHAKSEFLSRMSHELRTPLSAVIGFSELLLQDEDLGERREHQVGTILNAGEHLLGLINDVLDIARIEEGRMSLSPETVGVARVVGEVLALAQPLGSQRHIRISVGDIPDRQSVTGDHQRLKQVLINLVSNAVKYNHRGGWVEISTTTSDGWTRIGVRDSGPGLRPEEVGRLFSPFERLSAPATGVEGTGLGLALSKSLTEAMGGRIGVESTLGSGSTFWVELQTAEPPLDGGDGVAELRGRARMAALAPSLVLHVEDDPSNLMLVERIVAQQPGVTLMSVSEGHRALALARERRPDLILLDAHLPDMEAVEVLAQLRAEASTSPVPVVVLSADATAYQVDRVLGAGAREYLTKPIRVTELLEAFRRYLPVEAVAAAVPAGPQAAQPTSIAANLVTPEA